MKSTKRKITAAVILTLLCTMICACALANTIIGKGYHDGLIRYQDSKKKVGYMNADGEIVIKAGKFITANDFSNGLAAVQYSSGGMARSQYIDTTGKVVIKNIDTSDRFYAYRDWQGDYALVEVWKIKRKPSLSISKLGINYINAKGKLISSQDFMYAGPFSEGYALVGAGSLPYGTCSWVSGNEAAGPYLSISTFSGNTANSAAKKYYYIDMSGKQLGSFTWDQGRSFSGGYAAVAVKGADGSLVWGFIDNQGELAVSPQWPYVSNFANGMAIVSDGEKYGFINTNGDLVIPCIYDEAANFSADGTAVVKSGYKYGYINTAGDVVLDFEYSYARPFIGNTAIVEDGVGLGVINTAGEYLIPPVYETIGQIGHTGLFAAKEFTKALIVNENGKIVSPLLIDGALPTDEQLAAYPDGTPLKMVKAPMSNGLTLGMIFDENGVKVSMNVAYNLAGSEFVVRRGTGRMYLLNTNGDVVGNDAWDGVGVYSDHVIAVLKNNLYGFIDLQGNMLIKPQYTSVTAFENGVAQAYIGSNAVRIDDHGRKVLPDIKKNSSKEEIKRLQQALIDWGFMTGKADGVYGEKTTKAIKAAQEALGLNITGTADSATQYLLFDEEALAAKASQQAAEAAEAAEAAQAEAKTQMADEQTRASGYETLKPGSKGQAVLDARMKLYELGYFKKKPTQKEYTNNMKDYVKKFEKDHGLTQDGILSPEDQEVLFGL